MVLQKPYNYGMLWSRRGWNVGKLEDTNPGCYAPSIIYATGVI